MTFKERLKKFDLLPAIENTSDVVFTPEIFSLCKELSKELSLKIASIPVWFDYTTDEQKALIINFLNAKLNGDLSQKPLSDAEKDKIFAYFINSVYGFGPLDFLLSQQNVSSVFVKSHENILMNINGEILKSDITLDKKQLEFLISKLLEISGKSSSVVNFKFNNLAVTIIAEPVCAPQLILKKIPDIKYTFDILEKNKILNEDITKFLSSAIGEGRHFLISAPSGAGKTTLLNAFINYCTEVNSSSAVFEEGYFIETDLEHYNIENLSQSERVTLIKAVLATNPQYIFSDVNEIIFNIELADRLAHSTGFVACVQAESPEESLNMYAMAQAANFRCSEKRAKLKFAEFFDYIIQLEKAENDFVLKKIVEVTASEAGEPEFLERLSFAAGEYKYNFPETEQKVQMENAKPVETVPAQKRSFKARFDA